MSCSLTLRVRTPLLYGQQCDLQYIWAQMYTSLQDSNILCKLELALQLTISRKKKHLSNFCYGTDK